MGKFGEIALCHCEAVAESHNEAIHKIDCHENATHFLAITIQNRTKNGKT
ncbi:hypothetical protein [Helicobacter sp. 23-1045]